MVSVDVKHHGYWSMDISYCSSQACIICAMALEGRHQHGREGTNEHVGDSLVPASPPKRVRAHKTKNKNKTKRVGGGGGVKNKERERDSVQMVYLT